MFLSFYKKQSTKGFSKDDVILFRHILLSVDFSIIQQWNTTLLEPLVEKEKSQN